MEKSSKKKRLRQFPIEYFSVDDDINKNEPVESWYVI